MSTTHHDTAAAKLAELKPVVAPGNFAAKLDEIVPGWRANSGGLNGYGSDPNHHWRIIVARSLHDALPEQFGGIPFNWEQQHGFASAVSYGGNAVRTQDELTAWIDRAIARNDVVRADI
jgi:hypothetical protein